MVCRNGELKEYLAAGISREEFFRRVGVVLESRAAALPASDPAITTTSTPEQERRHAAHLSQSPAPIAAEIEHITGAERQSSQQAQRDSYLSSENGEDLREDSESCFQDATPVGSHKLTDTSYALMQRKRQQDAREERARILKRVEDDKIERRHREAQRKAEVKGKEKAQLVVDMGRLESTNLSTPTIRSKECALQIRLFDGSTIRSRFPSSGTLLSDVRPWSAYSNIRLIDLY
jgi:hypothetical protein